MNTRAWILVSALAGSANAQIVLTQLAPAVDLSSTSGAGGASFIGANPSAVAWDGTTLWVAGFNNSGLSGDVAIVRVSTPLATPTISNAFGVRAGTVSSRGYTGLAIQGTNLAAAYDNGASDPNGIVVYDASALAPLWSQAARGSSGVDFDPDFNAAGGPQGTGTGWTTFGSGRRALNDTPTGGVIWSTANGMIFDGAIGTVWRDIVFDPQTGDLYARNDNRLTKSVRSGSNATGASTVIGGLVTAAGFLGQNVEFLDTVFGDFLILNDRADSGVTQSLFTVVKAFSTSGSAATITWPAGFTPPVSTAWYDFSYHSASETLAVLDFTGRAVYLFGVGTTQAGTSFCSGDGSGTACPCGNSGLAGNGCASSVNPAGANLSGIGATSLANDQLVLYGAGMPNSSALYFQGTSQVSGGLGSAFGDGLRCAGGTIIRLGTKTNVGGASQYPAPGDLPVSQRGLVTTPGTRTYQVWYRNAATFCTPSTFNLTNGYEITWAS
jgi:hypothetical protein